MMTPSTPIAMAAIFRGPNRSAIWPAGTLRVIANPPAMESASAT